MAIYIVPKPNAYSNTKAGMSWVMQLLSGAWFGLARKPEAIRAEHAAAGTSGFNINEICPTAGKV
jgi:hypothetical protein